jgi:hypothetical protein
MSIADHVRSAAKATSGSPDMVQIETSVMEEMGAHLNRNRGRTAPKVVPTLKDVKDHLIKTGAKDWEHGFANLESEELGRIVR